jgi:UDP-glucose 4-epimerase
MTLKNKKILVTGGAGFIGSHTIDVLIQKGAKVVILDNLSTGKKENIHKKAKFYKANIADPKIENIFQKEKPEIVYHFAFNVQVPESVKNPLLDKDSIIGSINIFENAKKYGAKKLIFASSGFIYGNNNNLPIKEGEPMEPVSSYSVAKKTAENYLMFFRKVHGLPGIVLRYATIYGPGQVRGAMSDYIRKLAAGRQAKIWGDGQKTRDYVYIDDVVGVNIAVLDLPDSYKDPIFNVGTGKEITLNQVYKRIAELLGKAPKPIYLSDRPGEQIRYCLDCTKIKKALGWQAEYNIENGLILRLKEEGYLK